MPYFVNFFCFLFLFISSSSLKASDGSLSPFSSFRYRAARPDLTAVHQRFFTFFLFILFTLFINLLAFSILLPGFPMGYFHPSKGGRSMQGYRFPSVQSTDRILPSTQFCCPYSRLNFLYQS